MLENDTYEIWDGSYHQELINEYIPPNNGKSFKSKYDIWSVFEFNNNQKNQNLTTCNEWVYSKKYNDKTLISEVNLNDCFFFVNSSLYHSIWIWM